ncbi:signal transduction histidine kinase regulating citrate/malate metabolism [Halorubrum distributum JCM 9100]|uniref:Signal transduction histidine kinase regulating citrate/malate metabolism n=3 Tax=Halorubrum distributum TaxID=29283 RepID=M0EDB8_9EURY|nr:MULTISPECIES: histidine kinase N-terminal 7TM domain-containing protein [Halorubrum distributum group]ELZ45013.1 signal transduction histidine kinase regulating citrate/malate metabolism [Halorubrum distributum JCM 9100]ELZ51003.1 signal transduction histidine kinase regulating citrate/malate metabolism [Halorubrum distributum JCM 10118]MYL16495.1 PAS domain-containing protein [Halorubrum terrestre]
MFDAVPAWPVAGSFAGGAGAVLLAWAIRERRGRPGVDWFLAVFAAQATWCFAYGTGLLVADPALRALLETATWLGIIWTGVTFLGFALEYTGRSDVVRSRLFATIVGFGLLSTTLLVTNSLHGAFWTDFGPDPAFGVETVSYALGPWAYLTVAAETVLVASAVFLLVDTLLSYGPLYRRESAAVALSPIPPGFALVAWALSLGPVPQLQLAPIMFVPHVLLDAYAFDRAEMFERNPTTSRAAERTAIDDLRDPIVALGLDHRVVRLNPAAEAVLGVGAETARDRPLADFLDLPVGVDEAETGASDGDADPDDGASRETVRIDAADAAGRRTYAVSVSRLTDPNETHVGYTVVLSDVTERERRRQQLEVLNRILRHNLRNDAGVVHGYGEILRDRLEDPELVRMADAVERRAGALAALGEKAGTVERLLAESDPAETDVRDLLKSVVADARDGATTVELVVEGGADGDSDWTTRVRPDALRAVVENTVENAVDHHDGEGVEREDGGAWVRVALRREGGNAEREADGDARFVLTVEDDGPGIPDHEVDAVESGRETALEHGSGLGLWVVAWGAAAVGADVEYADREPRGTRVTVSVPVVAAE